jgi:hypothetical protein
VNSCEACKVIYTYIMWVSDCCLMPTQ